MMYYTVYKITNTVNGKIYVGTHITSNVEDDYMGSGTLLRKAYKKYGAQVFIKEIIHVFDNMNDMFNKEAEIVNESFVADKNTYNLKVGGSGGWDYINRNGLNWSQEKNTRISGFRNPDPIEVAEWRKASKAALNAFWSQVKQGIIPEPENPRFTGKSHTHESKRRTGDANSVYQKGSGNSQFGKCWITDGAVNMKVSKEEAVSNLPTGFRMGRVMAERKKIKG